MQNDRVLKLFNTFPSNKNVACKKGVYVKMFLLFMILNASTICKTNSVKCKYLNIFFNKVS